MEALGQILSGEEDFNFISKVVGGEEGTPVSYLLFVDDALILFDNYQELLEYPSWEVMSFEVIFRLKSEIVRMSLFQ